MALTFATVDDVSTLWRILSAEETERADKLIPIICADLRTYAKKRGKDLDALVAEDEDLALTAKSVTVDVVARTLMTSTNAEPMSQVSESALGYTFSGTPLVAGGGLFIKNSEYARLGLRRQRFGAIDIGGCTDADD